jgi:hypothetical protein
VISDSIIRGIASRKVYAFPMLSMIWRYEMLIVSLLALGGIGLLGGVVLLVVCSGINDGSMRNRSRTRESACAMM